MADTPITAVWQVARFPARLCSRDGKLCYYRRLEYDFLGVFCLASYFSSLLHYPGVFLLLVLLRLSSSHRLLSHKYVVLWCQLHPASSRNSFCFVRLLTVCGGKTNLDGENSSSICLRNIITGSLLPHNGVAGRM